jgi:hypothetical protein
MALNDLKEAFSRAYVSAIAHAAGYFTGHAADVIDDDGIDLTIVHRTSSGRVRSPRLDVQLKCTGAALPEAAFSFPLEAKNYDELIDPSWQTPRILVVVAVPKELDEWLDAKPSELTLRHVALWKSLRLDPASSNTTSVTVRLDPSVDRLTPTSLQAAMNNVLTRGFP